MENLSEHRDRANKADSNELRTTHPIHVWLREIRQRWGTRLVISDVAIPNQRAVRHWRSALQIAIKPRLVGREPYGVRTEAPLRLSRGPRTGL